MNEESPQATENRPKKVTTTIRFDAELHDALNTFAYEAGRGIPPKDRPSKDSLVQLAVKRLISEEPKNEIPARPEKADAEYNNPHLIKAASALADMAMSLADAAKEIQAATNANKPTGDDADKRVRDLLSATADNTRAVLDITGEIKAGAVLPKRGKRPAHS